MDAPSIANLINPTEIDYPDSIAKLVEQYPNYVRDIADFRFVQKIGEGGYGKVWLGIDSKTGTSVAVKELKTESQTVHNRTLFIREIITMICSNCSVIMKLVGFTCEAPYLIIMEYMINGNLADQHIHIHGVSKMSGTHLQSIAAAITFGLAHLHKRKIIHRDLKLSNILLDDNLIPRLTDFGTSRILKDDENWITPKVGTQCYMAPECYDIEYDFQADIFSLAFVLFELAEQRPAWFLWRNELVTAAIKHTDERPIFEKTPLLLQRFIKKCWDPDPAKRPSARSAYNSLSKCIVCFPGTDKNRVFQFCKGLEQNQYKRDEKVFRDPPPLYVDIKRLQNKLRGVPEGFIEQTEEELAQIAAEKAAATNPKASKPAATKIQYEDTFDPTTLQDFVNPNWAPYVDAVSVKLYPHEFPKYYEILSPLLAQDKDIFQKIVVFKVFIATMDHDPKFIDYLDSKQFFEFTNFTDRPVVKQEIGCYCMIAKHRPYMLMNSMIPILQSFIDADPQLCLAMFSHFIKNVDTIFSSKFLIDLFWENEQKFEIDSFSLCMVAVARAFKECVIEREAKYSTLMDKFFRINPRLAALTFGPIIEFLKPNFETILETFDDAYSQEYASFLGRINQYPASRRIASLLITVAKESEIGSFALVKYIFSSIEAAHCVAMNDDWYGEMLPTLASTFRIIFSLFCYPQLRTVIGQHQNFPKLCLLGISDCSDAFYPSALVSVIRRSGIGPPELLKLHETGFIKQYFDFFISSSDPNISRNGVALLDTFARIAGCPEYSGCIPKLIHLMKVHEEMVPSIIGVFTVLSAHLDCQVPLIQGGLVDYFKGLMGYEAYKPYATVFLTNMKIDKP